MLKAGNSVTRGPGKDYSIAGAGAEYHAGVYLRHGPMGLEKYYEVFLLEGHRLNEWPVC